MFIVCCAKRFLLVQTGFKAQKCKIEESITNPANGKHRILMDYLKYHFDVNYIDHFWCSAKKLACENCNYTLDDLR